ncbi:MAG: hypothetical protein Q8N99_06495 [Nanoarchaeota archaeon]|nr:hypothetical protein [Nanoarchaeota archaeon]
MAFSRRLLYASVAFFSLLGSFYIGYSTNKKFNPPQVISTPNSNPRTCCDELEKEVEKKDVEYQELIKQKLEVEKIAALAEKREAEAEVRELKVRRDALKKPYELEKENNELKLRIIQLEGRVTNNYVKNEEAGARYEANIAETRAVVARRDCEISMISSRLSTKDAYIEKLKALHEKELAIKDTEKARLETYSIKLERIIENARRNGYVLPVSRN